jgi:glycosyltransferase involved in cell wall biosynthesis
MRILFVNHSSSLTGAPISCLNIITRINENFIPFFVTKENGPIINELKRLQVKTYIIEKKGFLGIQYIKSFLKIIDREKIDLIHLNTLTPFCKYAGIAGFIKRIPIVWFVRENPLISRSKRLKFWLKKVSSKIVFVDKDTMNKLMDKDELKKVELVYNGVDTSYFKPEKSELLIKTFKIEPENKLIGYIGLITERKGIEYLIKAFEKVKQEYKRCKLIIIGSYKKEDEFYYKKLLELIKTLNLKNEIYFTGNIWDIKDAINNLDIVVLPSLEERCSRVLLESISCAKPVVASNVGGNPEIIQNGLNGLIVPPEDNDELAKAILKFLTNEKLAEEMGKNGRLIAEKYFDININIQKIKRIYIELAGK